MRFLLFIRIRDSKKTFRNAAGFTLIELLLVITLLAVLAVAAISAFDGNEEQARYNITRLEMAELQKALLQFRRDNRELPCQIYRDGIYNPMQFEADYGDAQFNSDYDLPALPATAINWQQWCTDRHPADISKPAKASNALYMINIFPYQASAHGSLFWDRDRQSGWNGPYISREALTDGWDNPYLLLDPELAYNQSHRCLNDSGDYATSSDLYVCQPIAALPDPTGYDLPADIVRIVSTGPNGVLESATSAYNLLTDDICATPPDTDSDDLILCLLR